MNRLFITRKLIKLSRNRIKSISFLIAAALLYGCGKDESRSEFVARVNDSYLTQKELAEMTDTLNNNRFYRNEIIRSWINRELLYQEALKQGITEKPEYSSIINSSRKELAAALVVSAYLENSQINFDDDDLEEYYGKNNDEFTLLNDGYLVNEIEFLTEEEAVKFRNSAVEKTWEDAAAGFENDSLLAYEKSGRFLYEHEVNPPELSLVLKELNPGELSVIINRGDSSFTMVQLLGRYEEGTIPPFAIVKDEVQNRYVMKKRKDAVDQYLRDLYSNNEIKIRN